MKKKITILQGLKTPAIEICGSGTGNKIDIVIIIIFARSIKLFKNRNTRSYL